jgi:hypothetical protein
MDETKEVWKSKKYYSKYTISNLGRVKHIKRNEIIKGTINGDGYIQVSLYPDDNEVGLEKKPLRLHRLVAELFCSNDNPEKKNIVNHINTDKLDNRSINLEWTTNLENTRHAAENGLLSPTNHRAVQRICPKTKEIKFYESITKAFEDNRDVLKYDTYIISVCNGTQKTSGGYMWKYVEENIIEEKPDGKEVEGFENYIITNTGKVYSKKSKRFLNPSLNGSGYHIIDLYSTECDETKESKDYTRKRHERRTKFRVHYLVAKHFIENIDVETKTEVNHKDKNRINNNVSNLEWVSPKENLQHAHNKKVFQYDKSDKLVKVYESSVQASRDNNIDPKTLSSAIKNKTFTGGFYWKFES